MRYLSICSGIEAATVAWHELGWEAAAFSEIEAFPRAVLQHHYPNVPLHGDFTTIGENDYGAIDLLVGGTPCQSFSIAGLRKGLADDRGNLTLEFIRLAQRKKPRWVVWENVPGVLSIDRGRAFASFLSGLAECRYGFALRVLNAEHFGVPQRRRRVFVVGYLGDWRPAAAVLFEPESLRGDIAPRRGEGQEVAVDVAKCLTARGAGACNQDPETANMIPAGHGVNGADDLAHCLRSGASRADKPSSTTYVTQPIALAENTIGRKPENGGNGDGYSTDSMYTLNATGVHGVAAHMAVRRLTPRECERLQGFPDDYTLVPHRGKPAADGPRYKALGNSMAVPVMRWIGKRIKMVESALHTLQYPPTPPRCDE